MEGQGEVEGDILVVLEHLHPFSAGGEVAGIVCVPLMDALVGHSGPLFPVHCPFQIGGQAGGFPEGAVLALPAGDLSHSSTYLDRIGAHHAALFQAAAGGSAVIQHYVGIGPQVEFPQEDPGAPAHLLVHRELALASAMEYAVVGGAAAVGQGLVGNVHAVPAILLQAGFPAHAGIPLAGHAGYLPGGAHSEGVVVLHINFFLVGETLAGILPQAFFLVEAVASHGKAGAAEVGVVVADNLQRTGVPFARGENVGARPLKHRDQEGDDIALGVEVFGGGPVRRTLPAPDSGSVVEEAPVALPEGYMAAVKASVVSASAKPLDEGSAGLCVHFELVGAGLPVPAYCGLGQLFQIHALAPYTSQGVIADFFRP